MVVMYEGKCWGLSARLHVRAVGGREPSLSDLCLFLCAVGILLQGIATWLAGDRMNVLQLHVQSRVEAVVREFQERAIDFLARFAGFSRGRLICPLLLLYLIILLHTPATCVPAFTTTGDLS